MTDTGRGIIKPHLNGGKDRKKSQRHYQFTIFPTDELIHGFRIHIHPNGGMIFEFDNREVFWQFDSRLGDAIRKMRSFFAQEERIARKMGLNLDGYHIYLSGLSDRKYEDHQAFLEREMKEFYEKQWDELDMETKAALEREAPIPPTFDTIRTQVVVPHNPVDEFTEELVQGVINEYFREGSDEQNSLQPDKTPEQVRESSESRGGKIGNPDRDGQTPHISDTSDQSGYGSDISSHESGDGLSLPSSDQGD